MLQTNMLANANNAGNAVFAEPTGRRWNGFVAFWGMVLATVCFLLVILVIGAFSTPEISLQKEMSAKLTQTNIPAPAKLTVPLVAAKEQVALPDAESVDGVAAPIAEALGADTQSSFPQPEISTRNEAARSPALPDDTSPVNPADFPSITWVGGTTDASLTTISEMGQEEFSPGFFYPKGLTTF